MTEQKPVQKKMIMGIVAIFAGGFGIHRFLMGYDNWWIQLVVTIVTCGMGALWGYYDAFMIFTDKMGMADGRALEE